MLNLPCGQDLTALKIKTYEGLNLSRLLDHLAHCETCRNNEGELIEQLNEMIGGEKE